MVSKLWDIFKVLGRFISDLEEVMCMWDDILIDNGIIIDEELDFDFDVENYEECDFVNELEIINIVFEMYLKGLEDLIVQLEFNVEIGENVLGQ